MISSNIWYKEIMTQKISVVPNKNLAKLILMYFILSNDKLEKKYSKQKCLEYLYRFYIDNPQKRISHPSLLVRNINKYGLDEFRVVLDEILFSWKEDFSNGALDFNEEEIFLLLNDNDFNENVFSMTKKIVDTLYLKYEKSEFDYNTNIESDLDFQSIDPKKFGKSRYMNRCLEDIQYCPLCEETDVSKLMVVRILDKNVCEKEDLINKNNGLILCDKHAELYNEHAFIFDVRGYLKVNITTDLLNSKMHLSNKLLNHERKKYIEKNAIINDIKFKK